MAAALLKLFRAQPDPTIELSDIQGLVIDHFRKKSAAEYLMLRVEDAAKARAWLADLNVTNSLERDTTEVINVAFTYPGLRTLWPPGVHFPDFSRTFREGMVTEHRSRILGDEDKSDPDEWAWRGHEGNSKAAGPVHVLLVLFAEDDDKLWSLQQRLLPDPSKTGLSEVVNLKTQSLADNKEHFGFREVGAQPLVRGLSTDDGSAEKLPAGEFILGYRNVFNQYPRGIYLSDGGVPANQLPADPEGQGKRDFGKNGTYLVFRQLVQDVHSFWSYLINETRDAGGQPDKQAAIALASKMVGRWPSGAPLARFPEADPGLVSRANEFGYAADLDGFRVPKTAHIRRANLRDGINDKPKQSLAISNEHRILRRGRSFGRPVAESMETEAILSAARDTVERGLNFICLNADIGRQFEFIQHAYLNNQTLGGAYAQTDPVSNKLGADGSFSTPAWPIRQRHRGLQSFVHVRGGAYFFLPGLKALKFLAERP